MAESGSSSSREPFSIGGTTVSPGERRSVDIELPRQYSHAEVRMPVHVIHGRRPGPTLFLSGAIHGDEVNGVEIIRRVLRGRGIGRLRGTLIAVPVVNVYGFLAQSRLLPDRRDLNRSFPGSEEGSLASRLAHLFMAEIVSRSTHGIDLHTGAGRRPNLPQIRACLDAGETENLARAFGAPVILDANVRDGSLRQAVLEIGIPVLLYEGGEALRFDELAIRAGHRGVLSVMRALDMLPARRADPGRPWISRESTWVRAPVSGILRTVKRLGEHVREDETLGVLADPFGDVETPVLSTASGVVIGKSDLPVAYAGDALFHVARFSRPGAVSKTVEAYTADLHNDD